MRDGLEAKMVKEVVRACTCKRGQTGRKIDPHETASGQGRTGIRVHEERKPEDCMLALSSLPERLLLNIH